MCSIPKLYDVVNIIELNMYNTQYMNIDIIQKND